MIKVDDFKRFKEISWKFKAVEVIVNNIRANVSRIWSDLPALIRNIDGDHTVKKLIDPLYKDIVKSCKQLNMLPVKYNRLMKEIIRKLQAIGAFINYPYMHDAVAERFNEAEVISTSVDEIFELVKTKLDIKPTDIDITKPNVIEIYIISQAKIDTTIIFLTTCKEYIDNLMKTNISGKSSSEQECVASIKKALEDTSTILDQFVDNIKKLRDFFEVQIGNVIETLNDLLIEIEIDEKRKEDIINQVKANELYNTLATAYHLIKPNNAFKKLMDNRSKSNEESKNPSDQQLIEDNKQILVDVK